VYKYVTVQVIQEISRLEVMVRDTYAAIDQLYLMSCMCYDYINLQSTHLAHMEHWQDESDPQGPLYALLAAKNIVTIQKNAKQFMSMVGGASSLVATATQGGLSHSPRSPTASSAMSTSGRRPHPLSVSTVTGYDHHPGLGGEGSPQQACSSPRTPSSLSFDDR
jgi:hypothetical protein